MPPATSSRFSDSEFVQHEKLLLSLANEGDTGPVDKNMIRQWLAEAPDRMKQTSLAAWVSLTGLLVWVTVNDKTVHPDDSPLVRAVLDHALNVPIHVWMAEGKPLVERRPNPDYIPSENDPEEREDRPAYDALHGLIQMFALSEEGAGPHPTFSAVLASGWEPGPLLGHLDQAREIQALYVETQYTPKTHTAQGTLLSGVLSAIGTSKWQPQAHPAMAMLWDKNVHGYYQYDHFSGGGDTFLRATARRQAAQKALQTFPEYAGLALNAFLDWPLLRRNMDAGVFFPFPFEQSHGMDTLHALGRCWQSNSELFPDAALICKELTKHHPDIANLLKLHCSFYTQPSHALQNLANILEGFEHIIGVRTNQTIGINHLDIGS